MGKYISKNISKNLSGKYNQKILNHNTNTLKTSSKKVTHKQQKQLVI